MRRCCTSSFLLYLLLAGFSASAYSVVINHKMYSGLTSSAEYITGQKSHPAVLILHGMLQTRHYITVQSLITAIGDEGYTVLAPNLSLGISDRKKSLPCEAIHNHNMAQDIDEIDYWVKWLEKQGHSSIYLVGHSFGSLQILLFSNTKKRSSVKKLIATSLIDVEKSNNTTLISDFLTSAKQSVLNNDTKLHEYAISYCTKYLAPAKDYLSYAKWTKQKLIKEIQKLKVPITVILGSKDLRVDQSWISYLKKTRLKLLIIQGANHFFDTTHEFEMNDLVLNELSIK